MADSIYEMDISKPVINTKQLEDILKTYDELSEELQNNINVQKSKKYLINFINKIKKHDKIAYIIINKKKKNEYKPQLIQKTFDTIQKTFNLNNKQIVIMDYNKLDLFTKAIVNETPFSIVYRRENEDLYLEYLNSGYLLLNTSK